MLHLPIRDELASSTACFSLTFDFSEGAGWSSTFHWLNLSVDIERAEQFHVMLVDSLVLLASLCFVTCMLMDKFD